VDKTYANLNFVRLDFRQESYADADINPETGEQLDFGSHDLELSGAAKTNEGMFE
jgi:hypothetical protein